MASQSVFPQFVTIRHSFAKHFVGRNPILTLPSCLLWILSMQRLGVAVGLVDVVDLTLGSRSSCRCLNQWRNFSLPFHALVAEEDRVCTIQSAKVEGEICKVVSPSYIHDFPIFLHFFDLLCRHCLVLNSPIGSSQEKEESWWSHDAWLQQMSRQSTELLIYQWDDVSRQKRRSTHYFSVKCSMNHIIRVIGKNKMINWFSPQAVCSSTFCSERRWKLLSWSFKRRSRAWAMRYDAVSIICGKIRPSWLNIASFLPDFQTDFSLIQKWKGKRFRHFGVGSNRHQCFSKYVYM